MLTPSGTPPTARFGSAGIYDGANDRMIVFGGRNSYELLGDSYALETDSRSDFPVRQQLCATSGLRKRQTATRSRAAETAELGHFLRSRAAST